MLFKTADCGRKNRLWVVERVQFAWCVVHQRVSGYIIIIIIIINLEAVPGKHSIDSLQKTAVLGTSHIIRKVLQCEA